MSLPIYQRVAVTDAGDVIPGAEYTVINENTGVAAPIYSDRTGATLLSPPYFADSAGTIQFFIAQGTTFRVAASGGVGTYTDRYVYGVAEAVLVQADGNVGINTTSPSSKLDVQSQTNNEDAVNFSRTTSTDTFGIRGDNSGVVEWRAGGSYGGGGVRMAGGSATSDGNRGGVSFHAGTGSGGFQSERVRIDSAGNLLVGTTTTSSDVAGHVMYGGALAGVSTQSAAARPLYINRLSSDGDIIELSKDGTTVGSIGSIAGGYLYVNGQTGGRLQVGGADKYAWDATQFYPSNDNVRDLGFSALRWDDIYATNPNIITSDRNEKQDIQEIAEAETAVAKACKGLLRSFRWKSAVEKKGDDARIHFGIISQDLRDAFTAQGLDAGRYAMFVSSTWWETQTEVPAVEAVEGVEFVQAVKASEALYNEDGEIVSEAVEAVEGVEGVEGVEAKDAYTRTDTFQKLAEAPAGATERTRLGVRYSELLAFIIAAI